MNTHDLWNPPPQRIAVFRALQLGDMLCAVPALRALRAHAPNAHITLIGLPWAVAFAERFKAYIDDAIAFPGAPGFPEQEPRETARPAFQRALREHRFDLAIQLHGSGERSNLIVETFGARRVIGYAPRSAPRPGYLPWPAQGSEVQRWLELMRAFGVPAHDESLEFPLRETDRAGARALQRDHNLVPGRYVCLHPGARLRTRRWPVPRYTQVGRALVASGWRVAVTGSGDEALLAERVAMTIGAGAECIAGATSLGEVAGLIADARLLVSNDTGVSHIAAAVRTPSVVIACGSDTARWAPADRQRHRVLAHQVPCRPCMHFECPVGHPCATAITVERVVAECAQLLNEPSRHAA